jgi:sulfotransferase
LGESFFFDRRDSQSPAWGIARGILHGAYEKIHREVIIDKDRGWASDVSLLEGVLGQRPKIIATVRDVTEIIASFILLSQGAKTKIGEEVLSLDRKIDVWTLSRIIWEKYVYHDWRVFKAGYENNPDCFLLVDYRDLVLNPDKTMRAISSYLGVSEWVPDVEKLENPNPENDQIYGIPGLHTIHRKLEKVSPPAREVIGHECHQFWASKNLDFWRRG